MTPTTRRPPLPALTGLRAVAAGWVVLFHYRDDLLALVPGLAPLDTFMRAGYLGVDLFFPLSGFVLAYTYADRLGSFSLAGEHRLRAQPVRAGVAGARADPEPRPRRRGPRGHARRRGRRPPAHAPGVRRERRDGAHLVQRPAELQRPGVVDQLGVVRLPARPAALRARRCGCAAAVPALALAAASYAAMLAVFATMALPNGNLEHMFYVRIMGEFVGGMLLCLAWVRGGARLGRCVVVLPVTLVVLALVPAAAAGHYWAAPALGLGVAGLAASSGWVTSALSWPRRRRGGGGLVRAVHDPPARSSRSCTRCGCGRRGRDGRRPRRRRARGRARRHRVAGAHRGREAGPPSAPGTPSRTRPGRRRPSRPNASSVPDRRNRGATRARSITIFGVFWPKRPRVNPARATLISLRPELLHPPAATAPSDAHEVHAPGHPGARGPRAVSPSPATGPGLVSRRRRRRRGSPPGR